mgnify:CR=1 FL=1
MIGSGSRFNQVAKPVEAESAIQMPPIISPHRERILEGEALRCLKRRLVRVIYGHLHTDQDAALPRLLAAA